MKNRKGASLKHYLVIGSAIGAIVYFILCGFRTLNPFDYDWILNIYHDSTLSFWGWIFYAKAPISDGVFSFVDMSFPHKLSLIFTDAIALFAILLKPILGALLSKHTIFQYIGIWSFSCYILQGFFASLLFYKTTENNFGRIVGIIVMCFSPIMSQRLFMHNTLVAQWLILAALSLCAYSNELGKKRYYLWVLLFVLATLTHLYYVPMLALIFVPKMIHEIITEHKFMSSLITSLLSIVLSLCVIALLGGFSTEISDADQAWSYSVLYMYSSNVMTGIIPLGYSLFLPERPTMHGEYEGFAYLGLGIIIAIICAFVLIIVLIVKKKKIVYDKTAFLCSFLSIVLSLVIGIGPIVSVFDKIIFQINLPGIIDYFFAIFRSIGRFIWVAYYIIITLTISFIANINRKILTSRIGIILIDVLLGIVLLFQVVDLFPMVKTKRDSLSNIAKWDTKMVSGRWEEIKDRFDYIYIITSNITSYPSQEAYSMYMYAFFNDLKLTSSYFAHINDTLYNDSLQYYDDIVTGKARERTLYWFENSDYYNQAGNWIHCETIDGYYVGWVE